MNTDRYGSEELDEVIDILNDAGNSVDLPSDIYFDIAKAFEIPDREKLNRLFKRAYTVTVREEGELLGVASMDNEGSIGILCVRRGERFKRAAKSLIRALERRAQKRDISHIFVLHHDEVKDLFYECGYAPFDNGSGGEDAINEFQLVKEIRLHEKFTIPPEKVKKYILDPKKPIKAEEYTLFFPKFFFCFACFFVVLLIAITVGNYLSSGSYDENTNIFIIIVGVMFLAALSVLIWYLMRGRRIKKEVLTMHVTNGVVTDVLTETHYSYHRTSDGEQRDRFTELTLYYTYYDEDMQKRDGKFQRRYNGKAPYFYKGQELVVACRGEKNYFLTKYTLLNADDTANEEIKISQRAVAKPEELVPLQAAKRYTAYAILFLAVIALIDGTILAFFLIMSLASGVSFGYLALHALPLLLFPVVIFGAYIAYFLIVPARAKSKYKTMLKECAKYANGTLFCTDRTYNSGNRGKFACTYVNDGGETRRIKMPRTFVGNMVKNGETAVTVAYTHRAEIVLIQKGKYPDNYQKR